MELYPSLKINIRANVIDYYEEGFPEIFSTLGFGDEAGTPCEIWVGSEWEFTNPPDEATCCLMVDWYFETLDITDGLSLNDHRCIRDHAQEFLESITNLHYPSAQMEARLYGLRLTINPPPLASPGLADSDIEVPKIVDELPPTSITSDVSKDIDATTSTRQLRPGPRTRQSTRKARMVIPDVTMSSDDESSHIDASCASSRSGHIESGGE
jgi:hypothetical protein